MTNRSLPLVVSSIVLQQFRCFNILTLDVDSPVVLLYGGNGLGKTSVLEALYYGCYLKSFRTHIIRDLVMVDSEAFFIKLTINEHNTFNSLQHAISIGFTHNKRLVKINNSSAVSYKDLLSYYRVVSLTEDDLFLIKGGPEERRFFIDQAILLEDQAFISLLKEYKSILDQRNSFLQKEYIDEKLYAIWTQKLWQASSIIVKARKNILNRLEAEMNRLLSVHFNQDLFISLSYHEKRTYYDSWDEFSSHHKTTSLYVQERAFKRSLLGIHLDDFIISFKGKKSRTFASRGQQKMIVLLLKIAQISVLRESTGYSVIFLLDDFMTDLDHENGKRLLSILLQSNCQLIFTAPYEGSFLENALFEMQCPFKKISI